MTKLWGYKLHIYTTSKQKIRKFQVVAKKSYDGEKVGDFSVFGDILNVFEGVSYGPSSLYHE